MKLSVVTTLYRSQVHVKEFYERITHAADTWASGEYELIIVNDGSPDDSLNVSLEVTSKDTRVRIIDLSRNFGHHQAIMCGLNHSRGDFVFLIDSDLEEDPAWLIPFAEKLSSGPNLDVVYGVQERRKGSIFERISGELFWWLIRKLSGLNLPPNITTARLMTRRYVDALMKHEEREIFLAGLWFITGFDQFPMQVRKLSSSASTYTIRRKFHLFTNSITSFSNKPLVLIFYSGCFIFCFAALFTAYLVVRWLFWATPLQGWTSVAVSIWLIGGLVISFMGIIGIYLSKIFSEVKARPVSLVRKIYEQG